MADELLKESTNNDETYTLYIHTCIANKKVYVGITYKEAPDRWKDGEAYKSNYELYSDIREYGWENGFFHQIVSDDLSWEKAKEAESYFIRVYDSTNPEKGYNHSVGGRYGRRRDNSDFGQKLKTLRKNKKITQKELSESLNISRPTISNWESNRRIPTLEDLKQIADYFSVSLEYFITNNTSDAGIELSARALSFFQSEDYTIEQKIDLFNDIVSFYSKFILNNE